MRVQCGLRAERAEGGSRDFGGVSAPPFWWPPKPSQREEEFSLKHQMLMPAVQRGGVAVPIKLAAQFFRQIDVSGQASPVAFVRNADFSLRVRE